MDKNTNSQQVKLNERDPELLSARKKAKMRLVVLRAAAMGVLLTLFFLFKSSPGLRGINPAPKDKCIIDRGVDLFSPVNQAIHDPKNRHKRSFIQIISSEQIDLAFITICLIWYLNF